jgi:hypothetical protein
MKSAESFDFIALDCFGLLRFIGSCGIHNPKVGGSAPPIATNKIKDLERI